ncbi:S1 RNA-binding domain-containing protein [Streptomyces sp. SID12501]|uniref:S1 RNA-binding domain-containing protein n=1 Tax=Streptomyces sp. SID12501 TaxID=2706042 RepID=A0A6B3C0A0_9ACTN|nr:S1 RNA-binding domain-containing protein [Streptomyces sp. SID12501]NEC90085.1 S1 RNA-binding domain-containing protein [Streptomyces sp. SID12501]
MVDSLDEAVRCAEDALRDLDGTRFERVANLMRFLDVSVEGCLADERWGPGAGAAGVRLGRLLLELGLRQEAERMFRLLSERLLARGVPEPDWGEQGEPFVNCLGVLGISLGQQADARVVLDCVQLYCAPRLSPAAATTHVNLAAVELGLGDVESAVDHALAARALLDRLPEPDAPALQTLHTVLDAVEHQLLGFATQYGNHPARALSALADRTGRMLDSLDSSDPRAFLTVVSFAMVRAAAAVEAGDTECLETVVKVVEVASQRLATLLGADHPKALAVQADLAAVQIEAARAVRSPARMDRAVRLLGATAQRLEVRLGPAHPRTVGTLTNLVAAQVEAVRALPEPGKAQRTADDLAERAEQFSELLGAWHPVTRLVSASAATCRRMAMGDESGRDFGGTTLVRTLVDSRADWREDGETYRSFRDAVSAVGQPPTPRDGTALIQSGTFHGPVVEDAPRTEGVALGSLVRCIVSRVDQHEVELEVGDTHQGFVPVGELPIGVIGYLGELGRAGFVAEAVVIGRERGDGGRLLLSMREPLLEQAAHRRALAESADLSSDGATVSGLVVGVVDGGLAVEVADEIAFLPMADIEMEPIQDLHQYVGRILDAKAWIPPSGSLVLSRRAWLAEADVLGPEEWLAHVQVGHVRTGMVLRVRPEDVEVDLGSFLGFLDPTDFGPVLLQAGEVVTVRVAAVNRRRGVAFVVLLDDRAMPWHRFMETHSPGRIVRGSVIRVDQSGVFVRVAAGVVGLVRIEELADDQLLVGVPTARPDEEIFVRIVAIDADRCRVELSSRQADEALGADPLAADFDPELYGGATEVQYGSPGGIARSLFEQHQRSVLHRRRRAPD